MKRILIAGALALAAGGQVFAADLPQNAAPSPSREQAPSYKWAGVYIGINAGYGFGTSNWSDARNPSGVTSTGDFSTNGFLGGGTIGANVQSSQFVFGVEADLDYSALKGSVTPASGFCTLQVTTGAAGASCETQNNWLGTFRGRAGFAADRVLFYGTAGLAFGNVQAGLTNGTIGFPGFNNNTELGWTAGAGLEVAIDDNWTGRIEYLYVDLAQGSCVTGNNCGFDTAAAVANDSVKFTANVVRLGIAYKFGSQ